MNRSLFTELRPSTILATLEATQNVLQSGANEKVLLTKTKLFARRRVVVRIENVRNVFAALTRLNCAVVVATVKRLEIKLVRWLGRPKTNVDRVVRVKARNRSIVGNSQNLFSSIPLLSMFVSTNFIDLK